MVRGLKALIVQHEEPTPAGILGEWLDRRKVEIHTLRIDLEEKVPELRDYDLIAALGSELHAFDDSVPFIDRESRLLREAVGADVPVLGLCFGGQLMARALGGRSFRAKRPEIGWFPVHTRDAGLVPDGPWFEWHVDSFSLPPGARLVAESDAGPQAYVVGRSLGLQFHPEVTPEIVEGWVRSAGDDGHAVDLDALLDETKRRAPVARRMAEQLFERFFDNVAKLRPDEGGVS